MGAPMAIPKIGDKLPDFTLPAGSKEGKKEVTFSKELGQGDVVLAFFPIAFSGTCTQEVCDFRDNLAAFRDVNAKVLGFSVDPHHVNTAFAKQENLDFPILSDANHEVVEKIWDTQVVAGYKGRARRGVVVVGKDGRVKYVHVDENVGAWTGLDAVKKAISG